MGEETGGVLADAFDLFVDLGCLDFLVTGFEFVTEFEEFSKVSLAKDFHAGGEVFLEAGLPLESLGVIVGGDRGKVWNGEAFREDTIGGKAFLECLDGRFVLVLAGLGLAPEPGRKIPHEVFLIFAKFAELFVLSLVHKSAAGGAKFGEFPVAVGGGSGASVGGRLFGVGAPFDEEAPGISGVGRGVIPAGAGGAFHETKGGVVGAAIG